MVEVPVQTSGMQAFLHLTERGSSLEHDLEFKGMTLGPHDPHALAPRMLGSQMCDTTPRFSSSFHCHVE